MADLIDHYDRINGLLDERDAVQAKIQLAYQDVKKDRRHPKALRAIITRDRQNPRRRKLQVDQERLEGEYAAELEEKVAPVLVMLRAGHTLDEVAAKTNVPRRTVARCAELVPKNQRNGTAAVARADACDQHEDDLSIPIFLRRTPEKPAAPHAASTEAQSSARAPSRPTVIKENT